MKRTHKWRLMAALTIVGAAMAVPGLAQADGNINIEVNTGPADADAAPGIPILVGETVRTFYQVTNTSGVTLTNIVVVDDNPAIAVRCPAVNLLPGASTVCESASVAVLGQYATVGRVTANSVDGSIVASAEDPTHYFGVRPSIDLASAFADAEVAAGESSSLDLVVTNTGNVDLDQISLKSTIDPRLTVSSVRASDGDANDSDDDPQTVEWLIGTLGSGQAVTVTVEFVVSAGSTPALVTNAATAEVPFVDAIDNSVVIATTADDMIAIVEPDADGDGVPDIDDVCAGSEADLAPSALKKNRIWTDSSDLSSTFGCSASQIIADAGLGSGHARFGISKSAMTNWIASQS